MGGGGNVAGLQSTRVGRSPQSDQLLGGVGWRGGARFLSRVGDTGVAAGDRAPTVRYPDPFTSAPNADPYVLLYSKQHYRLHPSKL